MKITCTRRELQHRESTGGKVGQRTGPRCFGSPTASGEAGLHPRDHLGDE